MNCCNLNELQQTDSDITINTNFDTQKKRSRFIARVYSILFVCLVVTSLQVGAVLWIDELGLFFMNNSWIYLVAIVFYLVIVVTISCCPHLLKSYPLNVIILCALVETLTLICAIVTLAYDTKIVILAAGSTAAMCFLISVISYLIPIDITKCGLFLTIFGVITVLFGIVSIIGIIAFQYYFLNIIYSFISVFLIGMFLAYDTQMLFGGRNHQLEEDDFIAGVLSLYLDVVLIFLHMLQILNFCIEN